MVHFTHDVLIVFKDGSTQETSITDEEAFNNLKAGLKITIGVFSGNFILSNGVVSPFTNLTSNTLRTLQDEDSSLRIQIVSASTKNMDITDIHEFEKLEDFIPPDEPPPIEPPPDDTVKPTMVTQSIGDFEIIDNRITGEVLYIANSSFNPFWNGKQISIFIQFKDSRGQVLVIKENKITFTDTEREERIQVNESAFNSTPITVEFFVWVSTIDNRAFADPKRIDVTKGEPPPPDPPPIVVKQDSLLKALKGLFFFSIAGALLTSRGGK